ncbi:ABC transporter ATP-binding protein [Paenibacillus agilis]|nr:ABC transporter ATP-binding protein [Paenibacillus agilis]
MLSSLRDSFRHIHQLLQFLASVRKTYFVGLILFCASESALPIVAAFVYIDIFNAAATSDMSLFWRGTISFLVALVSVMVISTICKYIYIMCVKKTMASIRRVVTDKVSVLPCSYYDRTHSGDILSRMTNDLNNIEAVYSWHFRSIIQTLLYSLASISIMLFLHWQFALFLLGMCLFSTFIIMRFSQPIQAIASAIQTQLGQITERAVDMLAGVKVIKMFQLEEKVKKVSEEQNSNLSKEGIRFGVKNGQLESWSYFLNFMNYSGVIAVGVFLVLNGQLGLGILIAFAQLQWNMSQSILQLGNTVVNMMSSLVSVHRVKELLDEPAEPKQILPREAIMYPNVGVIHDHAASAAICFSDVSFSYTSKATALHRLNFSISKGQKAVLVGPSGSGKSTLFKLLQGFYAPNEGHIYMDGKSIYETPLEQWRQSISYLSQEPWLFSGTVYENIACGKRDATEDEVIQAAKLANIHDFIMTLQDGYQSQVGEKGRLLSGGQRQRIAISRAFLKDAPVLLLDEATSALDAESEIQVRQSLELLMKDRATILITHRLSVLSEKDIIMVLRNGRISEIGTHQELMNGENFYKELIASSRAAV